MLALCSHGRLDVITNGDNSQKRLEDFAERRVSYMSGVEISSSVGWLILGLLLVGFEVVTGTFVLLMIGVACLAVALLVSLGLLDTLAWQLMAAALLSLVTLGAFRSRLKEAWGKKKSNLYGGDEGERLQLTAALPKNGSAEVSYQGSTWTAVNESGRDLNAGEVVTIVRSEGVKLVVR